MILASILFICGLGIAGGQDQATTPIPPAPAQTPQTRPAEAGSQQQTTEKPKKTSVQRHKKGAAADCLKSTSKTAGSAAGADQKGGDTATQKPCPTPKVVVRNGGSPEPDVKLQGDSNTGPGASAKSTEELATTASENLEKISERDLNPSQQEAVRQIKEFIAQSKAAVAAGDLERGHNLAVKARLLSDELAKP